MSSAPVLPDHIAEAIVDPLSFANPEVIDETFAWVRREMPLAIAKPAGFRPFWVVARQSDILEVSRNNALFLNCVRQAVLLSLETEEHVAKAAGEESHLFRSLTRMDGREHSEHRRLTQSWFMPARIKKLEPEIRKTASRLIDGMIAKGGACDFVREVALLYPLHVIMTILGIPECDEPLMLKLTQEMFGTQDPEFNKKEEGMSSAEKSVATVAEFARYFNAITEDRRANPRDDLASAIANGKIDGEHLHPAAAIGYYIITATAGHDTTSHSIAEGTLLLAQRPELMQRLRDDPECLKGFVEETIRWTTPVKHFMRTAAEDTELGGQKVGKGDWMMLCYHSGNRDENAIGEPGEFDLARKPGQHVAFGFGGHMCLGQHLARMELTIFWEEWLARIESFELAGPIRRSVSNFISGPKALPIRFTAL